MDKRSQFSFPDSGIIDPTLPTLPSALIGRQRELANLRHRLQDRGNAALAVIHGLPGVGKTALLEFLVHDSVLRSRFRDGILWAGLGPKPNLVGHLGRWGSLL